MEDRPLLIADCPRCGHDRVTADVMAYVRSRDHEYCFEIMGLCRQCQRSSLYLVEQTVFSERIENFGDGEYINPAFRVDGPIVVIPDLENCPDHVPADIRELFDEAIKCMAVQCYDASGAMFRKVLDASTRKLLPPQPDTENKTNPDYLAWKTRKDLGLRLTWLFDKNLLPENLRELAACVREDGNDAAHDIEGIGSDEAQDLKYFTILIMETIYTLPGQIEENKKRRDVRRQGS